MPNLWASPSIYYVQKKMQVMFASPQINMKSLTIYIENQLNATSLVWLANHISLLTFLDSIVSCVYVQVQTNVVHVKINHLYLHHLPCRYVFLHLHMGSVSDCQIHLHNVM